MVPGAPPTDPFDGAPGNTTDPLVSQVAAADMQAQLDALQSLIAAYPAGDVIDINSPDFNDGATYTYGSVTDPKVVTQVSPLEVNNGTTFTGFGILVVGTDIQIDSATFNWTGIVFLQHPNASFEFEDSSGQINGAIFMDASAEAGFQLEGENNTPGSLRLTYSCAAITMASHVVPMQRLGWIALQQ